MQFLTRGRKLTARDAESLFLWDSDCDSEPIIKLQHRLYELLRDILIVYKSDLRKFLNSSDERCTSKTVHWPKPRKTQLSVQYSQLSQGVVRAWSRLQAKTRTPGTPTPTKRKPV